MSLSQAASLLSLIRANRSAQGALVRQGHRDATGALWDHALWCAERALPIWYKSNPDDRRPRQAIEAKRLHLAGKISADQLSVAWSAAESAAWSAAESAARSAARSAQEADLVARLMALAPETKQKAGT